MDTGSYKTMTVKTDSIVLQSLYSARIEGRQDVEIYPQVSGTLQRLCVQEGDRVKKGQTLFIIDQVPYQAALNTAEANLKAAEAAEATADLTFKSTKRLFDQKVVSDFDLQKAQNSLLSAKASVAQMKAQVVNARNNLSYTVVKSPADGVVGRASLPSGRIGQQFYPAAFDHRLRQQRAVCLLLRQRRRLAQHDPSIRFVGRGSQKDAGREIDSERR